MTNRIDEVQYLPSQPAILATAWSCKSPDVREDIGLHQFYLSLLLGHPVMVVNNDYRANLPRCPTQGEEVATTINSRFHKFSEFKIGVKHGTCIL